MTNYEKFVEVFGRSPLLRDRDVESEIWLESEYKKPEQEKSDSNQLRTFRLKQTCTL